MKLENKHLFSIVLINAAIVGIIYIILDLFYVVTYLAGTLVGTFFGHEICEREKKTKGDNK